MADKNMKTKEEILGQTPKNLCKICNDAEDGFNYLNVAKNRRLNSCWECRTQALEWLEKECVACKKWLFGIKGSFEKTCSLECEQKYQKAIERQNILRGEIYRDEAIKL